MSNLDALEAALHDLFGGEMYFTWPDERQRQQLAVYADELQRIGDPRGELIALDLHIDAHGETPELKAHRDELAARLTGLSWARRSGVIFQYGFLEISYIGKEDLALIDALLLGPIGRYLRKLDVGGSPEFLRDVVTSLAQHPRPFLHQLELTQMSAWRNIELPARLVARAAELMPRLARLKIAHARLPLVAFPTVQELRVMGHRTVAALTAPGGSPVCFPRVHSLELTIQLSSSADHHGLIPPSQFPALRRLDISRLTAVYDPPNEGLFRLLRTLEIAPQLEHLCVPQVLTAQHAINLQAALDRMPRLRELAIAGEPTAAAFAHPTAEIRYLDPSSR